MKDLLEYIVKSIVNNPDAVVVTERESVDFPGLIILSIKVGDGDTGVVIGKRGRTINAIRDILAISAIRNKKRIRVILEEDDKPRPENKSDSKPESKPEPKAQEPEVEPGNEKEEEPVDDSDDMLSDEI